MITPKYTQWCVYQGWNQYSQVGGEGPVNLHTATCQFKPVEEECLNAEHMLLEDLGRRVQQETGLFLTNISGSPGGGGGGGKLGGY